MTTVTCTGPGDGRTLMSGDIAASLYRKLRPFLRSVPSWGCYTPARGKHKAGDKSAWPRHYWRGPGTFPIQLQWTTKNIGTVPTFKEFCLCYKIEVLDP